MKHLTMNELHEMTMKAVQTWINECACEINRTMVMSWDHNDLFKGLHVVPDVLGYRAGKIIIEGFHFTSKARKADMIEFAQWLHWAISGEYPTEETTDTEEENENTETIEEEEHTMKNTNTAAKKGYYNEKTLAKFAEALKDARTAVTDMTDTRVRISNSNSKMGNVASVSTLPFITCPACCKETCGADCYAAKLANLRPSVLKSYAINTAMALLRPIEYWAQVEAAVMAVRYFRFHVSGDIINADYFAHMVEVARRNPHTEILVFTKRYQIVNAWIDENGSIPENLHILFSGWTNLTPDNPHSLPETNIFTSEADIHDDWKICGGNCFNCACRGVGCWQAQKGDTIAFKKH